MGSKDTYTQVLEPLVATPSTTISAGEKNSDVIRPATLATSLDKQRNDSKYIANNIASFIEHTLLMPEATSSHIEKLCQEALLWSFYGVCVSSSNIEQVHWLLDGSLVKPIAVIGFPLGATSSKAKGYEAQLAIQLGAKEIDMVCNIGALKSKNYALFVKDIMCVVAACGNVALKVIIETGKLDDKEKMLASVLAKSAGATFIKTSTGFGCTGATAKDIELIKDSVGDDIAIKASGGIKTLNDATAMIKAGACRIGSSSSVSIVKEALGNDIGK